MSDSYIFILGNTPDLSLLELQRMVPTGDWKTISPQAVRLTEVTADFDAVSLMKMLGGTVKILHQKQILPLGTSQEVIEETLVSLLADDFTFRTFAIAEIGRDHLESIEAGTLKAQLKSRGINSRYIEGSRHGLSSAVLSHQKVKELCILQTDTEICIGETVAVQDIDSWTLRDRSKPYADRKKGMLPPKVARMMVNLALGPTPDKETVLLDPFCGSGTVLLEALERGVHVIGNDLDAEAAQGARENLDWYATAIGTTKTAAVYQQDATKLLLTNAQQVDCIVTEPFLGKPKPQVERLPNIFKGLEKQYLGSFKHWRTLLKPGGRVVCVFPAIIASHTPGYPNINLKALIDKLAQIGYTTTSEVVVYHRPQAVISRQIYQFVYKSE